MAQAPRLVAPLGARSCASADPTLRPYTISALSLLLLACDVPARCDRALWRVRVAVHSGHLGMSSWTVFGQSWPLRSAA
eukprot:3624479-Pyramimonas_sp.AAC.1